MRTGLVFVILTLAVLAGSTAYFATKATVLEKQLARRTPSTSLSSSAQNTTNPTEEPTTAPASAATSPAPKPSGTTPPPTIAAAERLAQPAELYEVASGDTLYPVGLKFDLAWERIAEANNLKEPYTLQIGQKLIIPTVDKGKNVFEVRFTTDPGRAATFQKAVDGGQDSWRLDPVAVAKAEHFGVFGLSADDDYRTTTKDDTTGKASLNVTKLADGTTKSFEIRLSQPGTKGAKGIWAIEAIGAKS